MAGPRLRAFRGKLLYRVLLFLTRVARILPLERGRRIGRFLGAIAWHVVRKERKKALHNLARAYPDWPAARRRETVREMFRHLGENLMEMLWMLGASVEERMRYTIVENAEPTLEAIRQGRGVVAFTGHCGNWEWTAATVAAIGIPLSAMQRERDEPELNDFITEYRRRVGIGTIDRGSERSGKELIRTLRNGGMIGMLIDQNIRAESAKVPFFGIPALTPIGPARLAIRTGSPVVAIFSTRRDGKHHVRFTDLIETNRDDDPIALTARLTEEIENQIRNAPEQWVWMHDRWRERPKWEVVGNQKSEIRNQNGG